MLKLRESLRWSFGLLSCLFALVSVSTISTLVLRIHKYGVLPPIDRLSAHSQFFAIFFALLARLVFVLPLAFTFLFGIAWWKLRHSKPSARGWAIAASLAVLLLCTVVIFAQVYIRHN